MQCNVKNEFQSKVYLFVSKREAIIVYLTSATYNFRFEEKVLNNILVFILKSQNNVALESASSYAILCCSGSYKHRKLWS